MSAFVISKRPNGSYKFSFASRKGKTIFTSLTCKSKSECEDFIKRIKEECTKLDFKKERSGSGKYLFRILDDEEVLATSRKFSTDRLLRLGIEQVQESALSAEVFDFSTDEEVFKN